MIKAPLTLICILSAAQAFAASTLESAKAGGESLFLQSPVRAEAPKATAGVSADWLTIEEPVINPVGKLAKLGAQVGSVRLADLLDHHRNLIIKQLGGLVWDISVAGDAGFKTYFMTFARAAADLVIAPLGDLNRLRGDGINITIAPGVTYNFRVSINIFNPVRGSTLHITAVSGTQGPSHEMSTGDLLDAVKGKSYVFSSNDNEYWLLHGTDVDAATNKLGNTRSFLFIHEAGMSSKAWPVAESALPADKPTTVAFGDNSVILTRTSAGQLLINDPQ